MSGPILGFAETFEAAESKWDADPNVTELIDIERQLAEILLACKELVYHLDLDISIGSFIDCIQYETGDKFFLQYINSGETFKRRVQITANEAAMIITAYQTLPEV